MSRKLTADNINAELKTVCTVTKLVPGHGNACGDGGVHGPGHERSKEAYLLVYFRPNHRSWTAKHHGPPV